MNENFTYKRPYGFILLNAAYKGLKTWKNLYIQVLKELREKNENLFNKMTEEDKFISKRGNPLFSKDEMI